MNSIAIPFLIALLLFLLLRWCRAGGGGALGLKVRESDHAAWQRAMDDKRIDLERLEADMPTFMYDYNDWLDDVAQVREELKSLATREPKI